MQTGMNTYEINILFPPLHDEANIYLPCTPSMPSIYRLSRGGAFTWPVYLHRPCKKNTLIHNMQISPLLHIKIKKGNLY
jgi:hypothetical protein